MGIEEEADRTLFIRNLDSRVTEELLFELFLQAGPLIKTKIPKDADGKQKTFGFAVYKHEVSVPYAMELLNGVLLFGRSIHVQFRSGSSHSSNSPGNSQNTSPATTPNPHGQRTPGQFSSPPYTPPQMHRSFSSPENLQKQAMNNNMKWQFQMQQHDQLSDGFSKPQQRPPSGGSSRPHDNAPYRHHSSQMNSGAGGWNQQRYSDDPRAGHHQQQQQQHGHGRTNYHHQNDRNRHHDNRGGGRYDDRGGNRGYQDSRYKRY